MSERGQNGLREMRAAEARGEVADSMEVRASIVRRIESGEITPEQGKAELARIKRGAKAAGKVTRNQAFLRGRNAEHTP